MSVDKDTVRRVAKLARLAANILPSRTMDDAASEMAALYREILGAKAGA